MVSAASFDDKATAAPSCIAPEAVKSDVHALQAVCQPAGAALCQTAGWVWGTQCVGAQAHGGNVELVRDAAAASSEQPTNMQHSKQSGSVKICHSAHASGQLQQHSTAHYQSRQDLPWTKCWISEGVRNAKDLGGFSVC